MYENLASARGIKAKWACEKDTGHHGKDTSHQVKTPKGGYGKIASSLIATVYEKIGSYLITTVYGKDPGRKMNTMYEKSAGHWWKSTMVSPAPPAARRDLGYLEPKWP